MLPRGVELIRVLHMRQRLVAQHFLFAEKSTNGRANKISCRLYSNAHNIRQSRPELHGLPHGLETTLCRRAFSNKKDKVLASSPASTKASTQSDVTSKTKTTKKTATEPKQAMKIVESTTASNTITTATTATKITSANTINVSTTPPASSTVSITTSTTPPESSEALSHATPPSLQSLASSPTHTTTAPPLKQTKTLEIPTSKGLLSITTTIEDSKINDVVFEKTAPPKQALEELQLESSKQKKLLEEKPQAKPSDKVAKKVTQAEVDTKEKKKSTVTLFVDAVKAPLTKDSDSASTSAAQAQAIAGAAAATAAATLPVASPVKPKRVLVDFNRSSLERNFITPARAMTDFLLKASDMESLSKIKRRSPYEQEPPITVYWRKDVEAKAIEVWGSRENLLQESLKRELERKKHQQNLFTVKRRLRDYRREIGSRAICFEDEPGLRGKSGKVVLIAIGINGINFLFKVCGWLYTGSHSMFAEAIHSLADTINQLILAYGIHKSTQMADSDHPYGYANMKYVSSLISGVGIFCVGTGLSFYHGITGIMHPEPFHQDFFWAFFILGGSLVSEGATLLVAMNEVRRSAKNKGISFKNYVLDGKDPCVNVVLTEDAAAVTSVIVAASCMGLTSYTGLPMFDAIGSLLVGGILGCVASFIIYTNVAALVGKSISEEHLNKINSELESDVMIRAIHDVKGIDMGNSLVRYKAEMDFDGRELTRSYLDKQDLNDLLKVVKSFQTVEELEKFLLSHGENIVDLMGGEIDRIEMKLRKKFPEIRHCDLEIL